MPIFLDPLARRHTNRAQHVRRRRVAALLTLIAFAVLAAAISMANRPEPVQPAIGASSGSTGGSAGLVNARDDRRRPNELALRTALPWILLIACTVVLSSLAMFNRRARLHRAPLPPSSVRAATSPPDLGLASKFAPQPRAARRAREIEDRWRQCGARTRRHRDKPNADWDRH